MKTLIDAVETLVELGLTIAQDLLVDTGNPPVGGLCDLVDQAVDFIWNDVLTYTPNSSTRISRSWMPPCS